MASGGFLQSTKGGFISTPAGGGGGSALSLSEEGSELTATATSIDVVGAALTATESGGAVTITQGAWSTSSVIGTATMTLGSDATGDVYYRNASGVLTRLGAGDDDQVLTLASGLPSWAAASGGGVNHDAAVTINDSGNDVNFRVESDAKNNMLIVDGGTNRVGIGLHDDGSGITPSATLHILTGSTSNDMCMLFQEDAANKESIIFSEAGYANFALQYDGSNSSPNNLFKVRCAEGALGLTTDVMTFNQAGNIGIGTDTFDGSAIGTLALASGTEPAAGTSGQCSLYAKDVSVDELLLHMNGANDGTTFTDSGKTGHVFTVNGNSHTDTAIKKFGASSAQFDGTGDTLSLPSHADFQFGTEDFTVELQVYLTDLTGFQYLLYHWGSNNGWAIRNYGGLLQFTHMGSDTDSTVGITINTWTHIAVCRVGTTVKMYVDGVEGLSYTASENMSSGHVLYIGGAGIYGSIGYIDEVRINKGTAYYTSAFTAPVAAYSGSESEAYVLDQNGNETKLSAHNEANEWEFVSKNKNTGKCVKVNMEKMIKRLEELHPGENFLEEWTE